MVINIIQDNYYYMYKESSDHFSRVYSFRRFAVADNFISNLNLLYFLVLVFIKTYTIGKTTVTV